MKTRKLGMIVLVCILSMMASACSLSFKAPVVTYDGSFELKVGRTTVGKAIEAGFDEDDSIPRSVLGGRVESMYAYKDGIYYGLMRVGNKDAAPISFQNAVVFEIAIAYDDPSQEVGEVLINGVNYENYTREQVKEAMGTDNIPKEDEEGFLYEMGKYRYYFNFKDDSEVVTSIRINDGTKIQLVFK